MYGYQMTILRLSNSDQCKQQNFIQSTNLSWTKNDIIYGECSLCTLFTYILTGPIKLHNQLRK